jgi:hypothetical protein
MGQAKQRVTEIAELKEAHKAWLAVLSVQEQTILKVAERIEERIVRAQNFTGGCYHLTFFMTRYLSQLGIQVNPVIGWVNDGSWKGVTSHGWIEFNGKKTDASLTRTEHPEAQPRGALIVLDHVLRKGDATYTYHYEGDAFPSLALVWMRSTGQYDEILALKEAEHQKMLSIAASDAEMDSYLARAPRGSTFDELAALIA